MRAHRDTSFHMAGGPQPGQPLPPPGGQPAAPVAPPLPPTIIRESQPQGFPVSALPPVQPAVPQPGQQPAAPAPAAPPAQPAWQPPAPAAGQPAPTELNQVLQGEHIPPHLRGRTVGEAMAQLSVLSRVVAGHQQPAPAPAGQPAPPAAPVAPPTVPGQSTAPAAPNAADFFRSPDQRIEAAVERTLQRVLGPTLGSMQQEQAMTAAVRARDGLVAQIGPQMFQELWPTMSNYLAGASQQDLANPVTWQLAARTAFGERGLAAAQRAAQGQAPPAGQPTAPAAPAPWQPPYTPAQVPAPAGQYPVQVLGPNGQPIPNAAGFFTESPSGSQVNGRPQLTPLQEQARVGMGLTYDQYYAWQGGVQAGAR